jgi:hypothetical protein
MRPDGGKHTRSGPRMNSQVPVALEWTEDGRLSRTKGKTIDISPKGCFVVVSEGLVAGQQVQLVNLVNGNRCQAQVVRQGQQTPSGWELGMQLENQMDDFWGLDF